MTKLTASLLRKNLVVVWEEILALELSILLSAGWRKKDSFNHMREVLQKFGVVEGKRYYTITAFGRKALDQSHELRSSLYRELPKLDLGTE